MGVVALAVLFKPFFGSLADFWECVRFWLTPDAVSLFRGQWGEDWWAEMKLGVWLVCGGAVGVATYGGLVKLLG